MPNSLLVLLFLSTRVGNHNKLDTLMKTKKAKISCASPITGSASLSEITVLKHRV